MSRLLITKALEHAQQNLLLPLRETTQKFLSCPRTSSEYNEYLQSISHIPFRTPEATRTVQTILAHVDKQQNMVISTETYTRLIRPSFTPVALLVYLHHRLTHEHPPPLPLPILLSFLSSYSKLSNSSQASFFFSQIKLHPHVSTNTLQHASTLLLAAQPSRQAAYDILTSPSSSSSSLPHNASASFHVLSKDLSIPSESLIHSFLRLTNSLPKPPLLPLYTSLINGLILRNKYNAASVFFNRLRKACPSLDIPSLSAGLNALTRRGNPHIAFQLLQSHYPPLLHQNNPSLPIITFLTALNRISRPDISTLLFFLYPSLYGPSSPPPSSLLLNLLLQAARTGYKMDVSIQSAKSLIPQNIKRLLLYFNPQNSLLSKLNLRTSTLIQQISSSLGNNLSFHHLIAKPLPPFGKKTKPHSLPPHTHASNLILSHLGHPSRGGLRIYISSSSHQSIPSISWAQIAFLRVLAGLGIGPDIQSPASSFILSKFPSPQPNLDSFTHLFTQQQHRQHLIPYTPTHYHNPTLWQNLLLPNNKPFYPSIIPTNSNFFTYLSLLSLSPSLPTIHISSSSSLVSQNKNDPALPPPSPHETPLVLAWMRTLSIQPSNSTLAMALVLWGEVCASVDAEERGLGEREYLVLVDYLRGWVGEGRLPHWRTLDKWRGVVKKIRNGLD